MRGGMWMGLRPMCLHLPFACTDAPSHSLNASNHPRRWPPTPAAAPASPSTTACCCATSSTKAQIPSILPRVCQVAAYTSGRSRVSEYDCLLLRHILWQRPDEAERIYDWLLKWVAG